MGPAHPIAGPYQWGPVGPAPEILDAGQRFSGRLQLLQGCHGLSQLGLHRLNPIGIKATDRLWQIWAIDATCPPNQIRQGGKLVR